MSDIDWRDPTPTIRRKRFAQGVASGKGVKEAAADAGFPSTSRSAARLLRKDEVQSEVIAILEAANDETVLSVNQVLTFWSASVAGLIDPSSTQMEASRHLGKALGMMEPKKQGHGGPVRVEVIREVVAPANEEG